MADYVTFRFRADGAVRKLRLRKKPAVPAIRTGYLGPAHLPASGMPIVGEAATTATGAAMAAAPVNPYVEMKISGLRVLGTMPALHENHIEVRVDGIEIPDIPQERVESVEELEEEAKRINLRYPLIPQKPKQGERIFAYAHIFYSPRLNELVYLVAEPKLDDKEKKLLENIKDYIQEKIDVHFAQLKRKDTIDYLMQLLQDGMSYFKAPKEKAEVFQYYVLRDFIGLGKVEPLLQDRQIEDISCDGMKIPLYVYHRNPKFGSLKTNVIFNSGDELDTFVSRLSERCGKSISVAKPLLDGTLPDGSRMQATLGSDIARHGSNFTIRMFTEKPLTPVDMISLGTCDLKSMAFYWFLIEYGFSLLIAGGTASGKTSLLNALALFIKPQMKIISIEDTAELRIPHSHWVPQVARTPIAEEGKVDMFELLRESLRQRPDYIIVGEVRGKEAYVLFQQMATGHPGLSTIHAENFPKLIDRLTSPPISLPGSLIQNLDAILFIKRFKQGRRYSRKLASTIEVLGYDAEHGIPLVNEVLRWDAIKDSYLIKNKSGLLKKIAETTGMTPSEIQEDMRNKAKVLEWMINRKITDYRKVASVINLYYMSPDFLLERIGT